MPSDAASPRPRPVIVTQAVMVAIGAVIGSAGFAGQIPAPAAWWIVTGYLAVQAALAFYLQSVVTPLSAPQDSRGVELVPADTTTVTLTGGEGASIVSPTAPDSMPGGGLSWTQRDPHAPVQPRPDL